MALSLFSYPSFLHHLQDPPPQRLELTHLPSLMKDASPEECPFKVRTERLSITFIIILIATITLPPLPRLFRKNRVADNCNIPNRTSVKFHDPRRRVSGPLFENPMIQNQMDIRTPLDPALIAPPPPQHLASSDSPL